MMGVRHWNKLSKEAVDAPVLAVFKANEQPGLWGGVPAHGREGWDWIVFKGHSNPLTLYGSMIIWVSLLSTLKGHFVLFFS